MERRSLVEECEYYGDYGGTIPEKDLLIQESKLLLEIEEIEEKNKLAIIALNDFQEINAFLKQENRKISEYIAKLNIMDNDFMEIYNNIEDRLEAVIDVGESFLKTGVNKLRQ